MSKGTHALLIHQAFVAPGQSGGTRHHELGSRFVRDGNRFTVIASDHDYLTGKPVADATEQSDGIEVRRVWTYPSLHKSFVWRVFSFFSFSFTSVLAGLRVEDIDVVMGTSPPIFQAPSAWIVALLRRKPFLLEVRDLWPEFAIDMGVLKNRFLIVGSRWLEKFLYSRADQLLVNSPAYRDYLIAKGVKSEKITLICNGVDPAMFEDTGGGVAFRQEYSLDGKFLVTYAGAMGMANDLDTLLGAAERLKDFPRVHILLVGDGKERTRLQSEARRMNLQNVTFTGGLPKTKMTAVLAASDGCLAVLRNIPMFTTTYPNKVFDYMAAGKPTILAIDGVIRRVVEDANGGVFVQPGDASAMAQAIRQLADEPERARQLGKNAKEYVAKHFNREDQGRQFTQLLQRISKH